MHLVDTWANLNRWREHAVEMTVFAGGLMVLALALPPMPCGLVIIAISMACAVSGAKIPAGVYLRVLAVPLAFLVTGSVAILVSVGADSQGHLRIAVTREGLVEAVTVFLRSLSAVSALILLALTTPMPELLSLLRRWRVPVVILELMGLVYRFLFVFDETLHTVIRAQDSRLGYRNVRTSFRSLGGAVASLFIRAMERARRLEMGLAARGYHGELRVLSCRHAVSRRALTVIGLTHLGLIAIGWLWPGGAWWAT